MDKQLARRIKLITTNLCPAVGRECKFNPPQTLSDRMTYYHTPGVSIAVINDFKIDWAQGFGLRNTRSTNPVTTETLFQAGSISKPIFALGVMRLVQDGRLDLDDDINCHLTSWRVPDNEGWQPSITWRQLLSHTAGLTVHGFPGYQVSEQLPTVAQILNGAAPANTARVEATIFPGTQFLYSGGGYTVAQQALVDLLQKPFPQIMDDLVLAPLELGNSTYEQPLPKYRVKRAATAHPRKGVPLRGKFHIYPEMAAAGLWTTPTDLAKVGVELMQVLHTIKAPSLLTQEAIEKMLCPQIGPPKAASGDFVGMGFFCNSRDEESYFWHDGWNEGFVAIMRFYKNIGKGAVVMINSNEGRPLLDEIMRTLAREYEWPNAFPNKKAPVGLSNIHHYAGLYASSTGMQFRVSVIGDNLMIHYGRQPPLPIFPSTEVEFFSKSLNVEICFEKDDKAGIVALTIRQGYNQIRANRQVLSEA